jgi:membrane protein YqaA with SNARE-associated domain
MAWGPQGLFLLAVLDSAGVPLVSGVDALLIAIATNEPQLAYLAATLAIAGSLAGSLILFFLARKGGDVLLSKHISTAGGARMHLWFQRYGLVTVFVPALSPLPLPMKIPVFCAGALHVRVAYFVAVVVVARTIRYFTLAYLGRHYGVATFQYLKSHGWQIGMSALAIAVAISISLRLFQRHEAALGKPE